MNSFRHFRVSLLITGFLAHSLFAQTATVGTIEGRAANPANGENLENVRITVEGTALETFTDSTGQYRLTNVPTGAVKLRAFRTGVPAQIHTVSVAAGQVVHQNFDFSGLQAGDDTVKLDQFVVRTSKEMDGTAIAINTQRFAGNIMTVVAADEFGPVADGNVGEVLKSIPGINIGLGGGGEPYTISLNGVPSNNVPVTVGGFDLANAAGGTSRQVGLEQVSINTVSRIEVMYTPTPETTGSALAGTVNMVPRSAFERSKPIVNFSTFMQMRDNDRSFQKTPGPRREPQRKVQPGADLSAIVPVNDRFGFTLSVSASELYTPQDFVQTAWRGAGSATNGTTLPDTTPDAPYLTDYAVRDQTKLTKHSSFGATIDYKLSRNDRLSFAFQYAFSDFDQNNRTLNFFVNRVAPGDFTTTSTHGFPGAGEVRLTNIANKQGGTLYMPSLTYRHDGPVWRSEAGVGISRARRQTKDMVEGYFQNTQARRQGVTVSFDDIFYLRPRVITVTDGVSGAPVDPYSIGTYGLNTTTSNTLDGVDLRRNAFASARRDYYGRVPVTLKAGLDVRYSMRDRRLDNPTWTFVGADGRPGTADDNAAMVLDKTFSRIAPYGFPRIQWVSNEALYDQYVAHPGSFTVDEVARYNRNVSLSKHAEETISAAYLRGDTQFFSGRLKLVGGVRAEQTNVTGEGQLIDATRNYQRDPTGRFVLGSNGRPLPIATTPMEAAMLTNVDRGLRGEKEYLRWFPSINGSYNLRENLIARAGYYWSVGRPDFSQYAGSLTLPDTQNLPSPTNRILVNNVGIKAWSAKTMKVSLEYYFERVGLFSVSAFRRDFTNLFGTTVFNATPAFLALYGLDPATYDAYDVSTQYNLPQQVRMTGVDFNYKQALTFLPHWARGVQVYANASAQRAIGDYSNSFQGFTPRNANWGFSVSRPKYTLGMKWNYIGREREGPVAAGRSIEPGTFNWGSKRLLIDVNGEYYLYKRIAVFAILNNINDAPVDFEITGPSTPPHAQFRQRQNFGSQWTFGIKGSF